MFSTVWIHTTFKLFKLIVLFSPLNEKMFRWGCKVLLILGTNRQRDTVDVTFLFNSSGLKVSLKVSMKVSMKVLQLRMLSFNYISKHNLRIFYLVILTPTSCFKKFFFVYSHTAMFLSYHQHCIHHKSLCYLLLFASILFTIFTIMIISCSSKNRYHAEQNVC